jgi:hypothetical protein
MAAYIRAADAIRDAFSCAVVVVHHCGVDGTRPRGHTSLPGAVDAQLAVKRDGANNVIVTVEFMKDGPEDDAVFSRLEPVNIGLDDDGEPITSCIVGEADGERQTRAKSRDEKKGGVLTAFRALKQAIEVCGAPAEASDHIPSEARVVSVDEWRQYCYSVGISASDNPRAKQMAFQRAYNKLLADGEVKIWNGHVWIPSNDPDSFPL